ncbi:MAG: hypothetical protein BROFUL_01349 [Candidatus Brocadia fulgida]|uniref:Uncharacterized protein n=1 Tax=Candidatus Brocadia fulgida TaxID=380242 RepID=A0A0M2UVT6_9BACT|nr:MAG: hypothetical protein BROFUL_01349 [Candidatus Brocadia fulgida]
MKYKRIVMSKSSYQVNNFTKKDCEVLNDSFLEYYALCALRKNLMRAVELAQHNNLLYSRNTIYAYKGMKLHH